MYKVNWEQLNQLIILLANKLEGQKVFGVPRGGLVIASILTHYGCTQTDTAGQASVIVDDIADTGITLARWRPRLTATLMVRKGCTPMPYYWVLMLNTEDYVLFPYENPEEVPPQLTQGRLRR